MEKKMPVFIVISVVLSMLLAYYLYYANTLNLPEAKQMDENVISAKQLNEYLLNELQQRGLLEKYDLIMGSIHMTLTPEHLGEISVTFVEKDKEKPRIITANLNTQEGVFYGTEDYQYESKLNPGIIHISEWKIDSIDAVKIAEEFFDLRPEFRYDSIYIFTRGNRFEEVSHEIWDVNFRDEENYIQYSVFVDPYTGELKRKGSMPDIGSWTHIVDN